MKVKTLEKALDSLRVAIRSSRSSLSSPYTNRVFIQQDKYNCHVTLTDLCTFGMRVTMPALELGDEENDEFLIGVDLTEFAALIKKCKNKDVSFWTGTKGDVREFNLQVGSAKIKLNGLRLVEYSDSEGYEDHLKVISPEFLEGLPGETYNLPLDFVEELAKATNYASDDDARESLTYVNVNSVSDALHIGSSDGHRAFLSVRRDVQNSRTFGFDDDQSFLFESDYIKRVAKVVDMTTDEQLVCQSDMDYHGQTNTFLMSFKTKDSTVLTWFKSDSTLKFPSLSDLVFSALANNSTEITLKTEEWIDESDILFGMGKKDSVYYIDIPSDADSINVDCFKTKEQDSDYGAFSCIGYSKKLNERRVTFRANQRYLQNAIKDVGEKFIKITAVDALTPVFVTPSFQKDDKELYIVVMPMRL